MHNRLLAAVVALGAIAAGCSSASPAVVVTPPAPPAPPSLDTKIGWVLRLENQRTLKDADAPSPNGVPGAAPAASPGFRQASVPDLAELVLDTDSLVRRRSAIALGRVKDPAGLPLLQARLQDPVADVRAAAAFGLGLLADGRAVPPLSAALDDPSAVVKARAIEALGLIGDKTAVPVIYRAASGCSALMAPLDPDADGPATDELTICRLALFALVRLQNYDGIAAITLDPSGRPVSRWWPVAYALQRINDPRAADALRSLAAVPSVYTAGFALRGLTTLKDRASLALARGLAGRRDGDVKVRIAAVRLLGAIGDESDTKLLLPMLGEGGTGTPLGLEVIAALGTIGKAAAFDTLVDLFGDPQPAVRSNALAAAAKVDPDRFVVILSGLGRDRDRSVRAALASVLATLPSAGVRPALLDLAADEDAAVQSAALQALSVVKAPELQERLNAALLAADYVVRSTAARLIGETKPEGGAARLIAAYTRATSDAAYDARAAAIEALAAYGGDEALKTIEQALNDQEWPVRTLAASLLVRLGRSAAAPARPAPMRHAPEFFASEQLLHPRYSPHVLVDTRHGTIEIQLDVVEAPITSATFVELVRKGFFNGIKVHRLVPTFVIQAGDPRGDGEGGPGFSLRDELSPVPYVRGTVGMALAGPDTAGSQWFITLSPQPHLDAKYTVFGRVVSGWDVLDQVSAWDVIDRIRIWDGIELR
jgi:cyclophilin family peptidyl-prolyl cis-trans isomerase/HEAT repeat protein